LQPTASGVWLYICLSLLHSLPACFLAQSGVLSLLVFVPGALFALLVAYNVVAKVTTNPLSLADLRTAFCRLRCLVPHYRFVANRCARFCPRSAWPLPVALFLRV
jgi:hypothetical protein